MMRILLIGYGKMGKTIFDIAQKQGHQIVATIDKENAKDIHMYSGDVVDVAIEFTQPEFAVDNYIRCFKNNITVVSGTTGWLDKKEQVEQAIQEYDGRFFYASNFSIGVNIFFHLNKQLAKMMTQFPDYKIMMEEIHHMQKIDAPSGTAITLAEGIIANNPAKKIWKNEASGKEESVDIISKRAPDVPGTHVVVYENQIDAIEIKHTAYNRLGFAGGAVEAAVWMHKNKTIAKGWCGMSDMLQF